MGTGKTEVIIPFHNKTEVEVDCYNLLYSVQIIMLKEKIIGSLLQFSFSL